MDSFLELFITVVHPVSTSAGQERANYSALAKPSQKGIASFFSLPYQRIRGLSKNDVVKECCLTKREKNGL